MFSCIGQRLELSNIKKRLSSWTCFLQFSLRWNKFQVSDSIGRSWMGWFFFEEIHFEFTTLYYWESNCGWSLRSNWLPQTRSCGFLSAAVQFVKLVSEKFSIKYIYSLKLITVNYIQCNNTVCHAIFLKITPHKTYFCPKKVNYGCNSMAAKIAQNPKHHNEKLVMETPSPLKWLKYRYRFDTLMR